MIPKPTAVPVRENEPDATESGTLASSRVAAVPVRVREPAPAEIEWRV